MAAPPAYYRAEQELAEYIQKHKVEHIELKDMLIKMIKQIEENKKMLRLYTKAVNDAINKMDDKINTLDRQNQKEHIGLIERLERHESLDLARHAVAAARTQPDAAQQLADPNISGAMAFRICCDTFGRCATTPMVFTSSTFADMTMEPTAAPGMGFFGGGMNAMGNALSEAAYAVRDQFGPTPPGEEKGAEKGEVEFTYQPQLNRLKDISQKDSRGFPLFKFDARLGGVGFQPIEYKDDIQFNFPGQFLVTTVPKEKDGFTQEFEVMNIEGNKYWLNPKTGPPPMFGEAGDPHYYIVETERWPYRLKSVRLGDYKHFNDLVKFKEIHEFGVVKGPLPAHPVVDDEGKGSTIDDMIQRGTAPSKKVMKYLKGNT